MIEEKNANNFTTTVRVKLDTYHKLENLVSNKKMRNLKETGKVGNADFDGIINDLLKKNETEQIKRKSEVEDGFPTNGNGEEKMHPDNVIDDSKAPPYN